jgi:hypothetical protein
LGGEGFEGSSGSHVVNEEGTGEKIGSGVFVLHVVQMILVVLCSDSVRHHFLPFAVGLGHPAAQKDLDRLDLGICGVFVVSCLKLLHICPEILVDFNSRHLLIMVF